MDALVLVGGYATRLQPLTLRTPKSLVPVAGKPALTHLFERLKEAGAREVLVSLNPGQRKIEDCFGTGEGLGLHVKYHYEGHRKEEHKPGALAAIQEAVEEYGPPKKGLVLGGDNFVHGLNLGELVQLREAKKAAAAIAFYDLADKSLVEQYGVAALDADGRVTQFQEKPRIEEAVSKLASTAFYACSEEFFTKHLPAYVTRKKQAGEKADSLGDIFKHYARELPIYGLPFHGLWGDANSPETYIEMNKLAMNRLLPEIKSKGRGALLAGRELVIAKDVDIGEGAIVKGPAIIEEGCTVGKDAVVGPYTHLLHHSSVGDKAAVSGSIVFERASIGKAAHVEDSLLDGSCSIGEGARVESYSIIGYKAVVGARARVFSHSHLWPFVELGGEGVLEGVLKARLGEEEEALLASSSYWNC